MGYTGSGGISDPCVNIDDCFSGPCLGGSCVDLVGGFRCECDIGWQGILCDVNPDDCQIELQRLEILANSSSSAENAANATSVSVCGPHGECIDRLAGFQCSCDEGFEGLKCETQIDVCSLFDANPCGHGGVCSNHPTKPGDFICDCPTGYTGGTCMLDENECVTGTHDCGGEVNVDGFLGDAWKC